MASAPAAQNLGRDGDKQGSALQGLQKTRAWLHLPPHESQKKTPGNLLIAAVLPFRTEMRFPDTSVSQGQVHRGEYIE